MHLKHEKQSTFRKNFAKEEKKANSPSHPTSTNSVNHFITDWIPGLTVTVLGMNCKRCMQEKVARTEKTVLLAFSKEVVSMQ